MSVCVCNLLVLNCKMFNTLCKCCHSCGVVVATCPSTTYSRYIFYLTNIKFRPQWQRGKTQRKEEKGRRVHRGNKFSPSEYIAVPLAQIRYVRTAIVILCKLKGPYGLPSRPPSSVRLSGFMIFAFVVNKPNQTERRLNSLPALPRIYTFFYSACVCVTVSFSKCRSSVP